MKNILANEKNLTIDLSFNPNITNISNDSLDKKTRDYILNEENWSIDLKKWLEYIISKSSDSNVICPAIIQNAHCISLGLELTDDQAIKKLNKEWRYINASTDVLSFALIDDLSFVPTHELLELGDIVISVATAYRQAKQYEHDLITELRWLTSHGLLHLLGWDHPDQESLSRMLSMQEQLLRFNAGVSSLGI